MYTQYCAIIHEIDAFRCSARIEAFTLEPYF